MSSIADLLPSALAVLGVPGSPDPIGLRDQLDGVRRIAVLLVDGLGYHLLPLAAPVAPTIADVLAGRLGTLTELSSGFPSTTPTSLVSLGTGALPGAHGILGFFLRIPGTDRVLNHVDWTDDPDPATWQPVPTQFAKAVAAALLVTADHGQVDVPPDHRYDIDADPRLAAGVRIVAGEPRVRYLDTAPGAATDVIDAWRAVLGDRAWVATREEAIDTGWYGPVPPEHASRLGDVVVVCRDRYAILATKHEKPSIAKLVAFHGANTPVETAIPLIVVRGAR